MYVHSSSLSSDLLICGFISSSLEESIVSTGIGIVGQVCGSIQEILPAFLDGVLGEKDFVSPGSGMRASRYSISRSQAHPSSVRKTEKG